MLTGAGLHARMLQKVEGIALFLLRQIDYMIVFNSSKKNSGQPNRRYRLVQYCIT
jgi:hypothetical protein